MMPLKNTDCTSSSEIMVPVNASKNQQRRAYHILSDINSIKHVTIFIKFNEIFLSAEGRIEYPDG